MAELTQEDRDNYENLKTAFSKLNVQGQLNQLKTTIFNQLPAVQAIINTDELDKKVELVGSFLKIYSILSPEKLADVQEIVTLNNQLKRSLKVVKDETVDLTEEIESFSSDRLFLKFLSKDEFRSWTEALLSDRDPNLNDNQINQLIQAWGKSVQQFVEDARKKGSSPDEATPGQPETFASFFCIHNELETLYSRLGDIETVQRTR